jgi:hypothetical protein
MVVGFLNFRRSCGLGNLGRCDPPLIILEEMVPRITDSGNKDAKAIHSNFFSGVIVIRG